ncbi:MAG: hypothetical protein KDC23_10675 [Actinobacteria bacterium]|nr:hypothetical protein [Actinomycetota bacterium]
MNREFLPEAVVGITVGLLLAVLAVYRTSKAPSSGILTRGAMMSVLLYAIVAAGVLVTEGLTFIGLLLLLVMLCLPVVGMMFAERTPAVTGQAARVARAAVSIGLTAAMLIAAAQTLSLLSRVDPRTLVVVLTVVTGLLVAVEGTRSSGRIGSWATWLLIVPILISLALGFLLGNAGQAISPIIVTGGLSVAAVVCLMVAFLVLGTADAALAASHRIGGWSPVRVLGGVFGVVILIVFGLLMFFGGAVIAPTIQFFVVPANIDALPGLAGVLLAVLTLLFAAVVAGALAGLRPTADAAGLGWLIGGAAIAAGVALLDPGLDWVVVATALAAASLALATTARGVLCGLIGAGVLIVVLTVTGAMTWSWWAALAIVVVAVVGRLLSGAGSSSSVDSPAVSGPEPTLDASHNPG